MDRNQAAQPTYATDEFYVTAPDGIVVHPIPLPGILGLSVAEGRLPVGEFGVHTHCSLEQVTYVLAGQLLVTMGDPATGATVEYACGPGDTISTPPMTTLSYRNPGPDLVRVLYICAPPYPADDADTMVVEQHRALTTGELIAATARLQQTQAALNANCTALATQIAALQHAAAE